MKLNFKGFEINGVLNQDKRWYTIKNGQKSYERDGDPKELLRCSFKVDEYSLEYSPEEVKDLLTSTKELSDVIVKSLLPAIMDIIERIHAIDVEDDERRRKRSENSNRAHE